jgi:hypothetical protein
VAANGQFQIQNRPTPRIFVVNGGREFLFSGSAVSAAELDVGALRPVIYPLGNFPQPAAIYGALASGVRFVAVVAAPGETDAGSTSAVLESGARVVVIVGRSLADGATASAFLDSGALRPLNVPIPPEAESGTVSAALDNGALANA